MLLVTFIKKVTSQSVILTVTSTAADGIVAREALMNKLVSTGLNLNLLVVNCFGSDEHHVAMFLHVSGEISFDSWQMVPQVGTPFPWSRSAEQQMAGHELVREGCQDVDLAAIFEHAAQAGFLNAELPLWPPADIV
jgi:hypothetical protein